MADAVKATPADAEPSGTREQSRELREPFAQLAQALAPEHYAVASGGAWAELHRKREPYART